MKIHEIAGQILDQHQKMENPNLDPRTNLDDLSMFSSNDFGKDDVWQQGTHLNVTTHLGSKFVLRYYQRWTKTGVVTRDLVTEGFEHTEGCYRKNFGPVLATIDMEDRTIEFVSTNILTVYAPKWADIADCKKMAKKYAEGINAQEEYEVRKALRTQCKKD